MTLEEVIEYLKEQYKIAVSTKWVVSPLAWAVYQTWKYTKEMEERKWRKIK